MRISDWSSDVCCSDLTAEQRRHFRTRLRKAEDVVDEEEHVLAFLIAEIFGDRQARQRNARTRTRRLVHLAEHERNLRTFGGRVAVLVLGDKAGVEAPVIEEIGRASCRERVCQYV